MLAHGVAHALVGEELDLRIDGQRDVLAVDRVGLVAHVFHHAAEAVAHHCALAVAAQKLLLEAELDAFLANVFDVRETHHMRRGFALGIPALVLAHLLHALQALRLDLLPHRFIDMPTQRDGAPGDVELVFQLSRHHAQQAGQGPALRGVGGEGFDIDLHRRQGHAGGQHQAVAVQDAAAAGRQRQLVNEALFALRLVEIGVPNLQIHRAAEQRHKGHADHHDNEARTPRRRLAGQQRAGGVIDAAHRRAGGPTHLLAPTADAAGSNA